jgi:enolase-phosphatase E1
MSLPDVRAVVTDIEGTTTALTFVKDVLFPYAREHMADFIAAHGAEDEVRAWLNDVRTMENKPALTNDEIVSILLEWIAADKKITPLKALQGMIWESGFKNKTFTTHMYKDALTGLRRWHAQGLPLYVYSSGSVMAQKLLFRYTEEGDLTPLFSGYFDTTIGGKLEANSYATIAATIKLQPHYILFLSDHPGELDAAASVGFQTILLNRDGLVGQSKHHTVKDFTNIVMSEAA